MLNCPEVNVSKLI